MDVSAYLQCFENAMTSYSGEDPLEQWDKFVDFAEKRLTDGSGMAVVLDRLVERFLDVPRYANDIRYVKHCIRCASYYSNPVALYSRIFRSGVGTTTAALYVAWAQQFEQRGMNEQADAVYQKAVENQALPADAVLNEYRLFQTRTKSQTPVSGVRTPLQSSQLTNQMPPHSEPVAQIKASLDCVPKQPQYCVTVSRSETSGMIPSSKDSVIQMVSKYDKEELVCEGSELCFEEVRAQRYFHKRQQQQEMDYRRNKERELREEEEAVLRIKSLLENYNQNLEAFGFLIHQPSSQGHLPVVGPATRQNLNPAQQNHLHSRFSSGLQPHTEPPVQQQHQTRAADTPPKPLHTSHHPSVPSHTDLLLREAPCQLGSMGTHVTQKDVSQLQELEDRLEVSLGGTANLSHITPNNSLGFVQATPSRALPSPTVNTREALDVIMDMFQAPTLLVDPLSNTSVLQAAEAGHQAQGDASTFSKPPTTTPFTIFQDDDKENPRAAAPPSACEKFKAARALAVIPVSKPNDTPPDLTPDETMWGARYNSLHSLAACPNSSTDFAMLAQFVSTPYKQINAFGSNICQDQENNCDGGDVKEDAFRCRGNKLSPIMEQSPPDEKLSETAVSQIVPSSARLGTIVGEGLSLAQHCLTSSSSVTIVQPPPPALLSFRDQTLCPNESSVSRTTGPAWDIYTSPEQPSKRTSVNPQEPEGLFKPGYEPFKVLDDLGEPGSPQKDQKTALDVPMSPECIVNPDWLTCKSPAVTVETDLDAFLSPRQPRVMDVPMSPEQPQLYADVSMSKEQFNTVDEPMMSPDRGVRPSVDVSMNATQPKTEKLQLVPDPWDDELISSLLSSLSPPLTSHPRCLTWQRNLPHISPKMTLSMGNASLRVDGVLGEGAFATVFQATDPVTSEKVVLKVQKPANPWEFYINTQLDARLQPGIRHLYSSVRSAHIFNNGSVLLEELHNYGTLLNAVNMYKTLGDKVMPQPLVMYFTICILHMVEQLHSINIIHADIKPDNFLLGERFMDNRDVDPDSVNHGLVLIDLGQSIDMKLFSENTAFTARCLTSGFQCTEMLSGKPWSYQTDYFGVAGTVHCLLFGTYMRVRNEGGVWKTDAAFRRNPHSDLWLNFFHTLLNVPDGGPLPSLRSLRCSLTSVLQQSYSSKLSSLRSRLVVLLLENHKPVRK